jgi:hypothetical protein
LCPPVDGTLHLNLNLAVAFTHGLPAGQTEAVSLVGRPEGAARIGQRLQPQLAQTRFVSNDCAPHDHPFTREASLDHPDFNRTLGDAEWLSSTSNNFALMLL